MTEETTEDTTEDLSETQRTKPYKWRAECAQHRNRRQNEPAVNLRVTFLIEQLTDDEFELTVWRGNLAKETLGRGFRYRVEAMDAADKYIGGKIPDKSWTEDMSD